MLFIQYSNIFTATLHQRAYRRGCDDHGVGVSRSGLTRRQRSGRAGAAEHERAPLSAIVHADYQCARVRGPVAA
jgi:hypothetical protein